MKRKVLKAMVSCAALLLTVAFAQSASAGTIFYGDRSAWEVAAGDNTTENYESYPWGGAELFGSEVYFGGFGYINPTGQVFGVNSSGVGSDAPYLSGNYLEWESTVSGDNALTVILPHPTMAVGFDFGQFFGPSTPFVLTLDNGDSYTQMSNLGAYAFLGAFSESGFSSFTISGSPYPIIDNVSVGDTLPVPEPGSMFLFGSGLVGCVRQWRKRRAVQA